MLDGRYRARSGTISYWMADGEVRDIIARRARIAASIDHLLSAEIDRDPTPPGLRQFGHLLVVTQPIAGRPEMLHESIDANGFSQWGNSVQFAREKMQWGRMRLGCRTGTGGQGSTATRSAQPDAPPHDCPLRSK